jgi:flagellar hook-length control protein FliK
VRFVQRVAKAFQAIGSKEGSIRLRLRPPELGSLRLELTVKNGSMTARLEAETSAARNALLDNLPALRDRLAQQDIKIDRFDVDLAQDQSDGPSWQSGENSRPWKRSSPAATPSADSADTDVEDATAAADSGPGGDGTQLNVVV